MAAYSPYFIKIMRHLLAAVFVCALLSSPAHARGGGCFERGTLVETPAGQVKIEDLRQKQSVSVPEGSVLAERAVSNVYTVQPTVYFELGAGSHLVRATAEHPFMVSPGVFKTAQSLGVGDTVYVWENGPAALPLTSVRKVKALLPAYNLSVMPGQIFVANGFIVHNKGCFLPPTPILFADGTSVQISAVKAGDKVLAFTPDGKTMPAAVREVITYAVDSYMEVALESRLLKVTKEHPFYVGDRTFKTVAALKPGDTVYAFDGKGLAKQSILSIKEIFAKTTVYNLHTDYPNTFFADGVAVHNKGGGGGFSGGHYYHSSSDRNLTPAQRRMETFFDIFMIVLFVVIKFATRGSSSGSSDDDSTPDVLFERNLVQAKAAETRAIVDQIHAVDPQVDADRLGDLAKNVFIKLQECWQERSYEPMRPLLMPYLFQEHVEKLEEMTSKHEINRMDALEVSAVDLINISYTFAPQNREFSALITASAKDYFVRDSDNSFLRGDTSPHTFQEIWVFHWNSDSWLLRDIMQVSEYGGLDQASVFERNAAAPAVSAIPPVNEPQIPQLRHAQFSMPLMPVDGGPMPAAAAAYAPPPPTVILPPLAPGKVDGLLKVLASVDKDWQPQLLRDRAKEIFLNYQTALEAQSLYMLPQEDLLPEMRAELQTLVDKFKAQAMHCQLNNLSVLKVDIVLVENRDEPQFTARIQSHARRIITKGYDMVYQDTAMCLFSNLWCFELNNGKWALKEILKDMGGNATELSTEHMSAPSR